MPSKPAAPPTHCKAMLPEELEAFLASLGEKPYRARQTAQWIHRKGAADYEAMTSLSRALRQDLERACPFDVLETEATRTAADGTVKAVLRTSDGHRVEAVLMLKERFVTACLSTQAGCALACAFCATGRGGLKRNLRAEEIVEQALRLEALGAARLTHVVLMGMGEPLMNLDAVARAVKVLTHPGLRGLSPSRITLSTAGLPAGLKRLAALDLKVNVALSLNATRDALRRRLMPVAGETPIHEVLEAFRSVRATHRDPRTLEYVLLAGVNDGEGDARELAVLARAAQAKVNLIPFNAVEGIPFAPPPEDAVDRFLAALSRAGVAVTVRRSRGAEIGAACGQLAGGKGLARNP